MSKYLELAERCEKASGPDRELDKAVALAVYGPEHCRYIEVPAYTSSIDAAMTLAGGLRGLSLNMRSNPDMGGKDWLVSAGSNRSAARSWSLALCAVGLRDRAKWKDPNYFPSAAEVDGKLVQSTVSNGDRA